MSENGGEKNGIIHSVKMFFEETLDSRTRSMLLIVILILFVALPLTGIAVAIIRAAAPVNIFNIQ